MSAQATEVAVILPKPLTIPERAALVFAALKSEDQLKALAQASKDITAITNADGKAQVHSARIALKNERLEITRIGEEGREDAVKTSKAIIERQKALVALIKPEEDRLQALQEEWDARIEREKQARIEAEIARVKAIQERITELRGCPTLTPSSGAALIAEHIGDLERIPVDDSFAEFRAQADDAKTAALWRLRQLHAAALAHEAEQERIKAERAELAKLRAEAADRERLAREAQAKAEAEAKAERARLDAIAKAERDRVEAAQRAERERLEAIARQEREAEAARLAAEREKLAEERAENERIARVERERAEAEEKVRRDALAAQEAAVAAERKALDDAQAAILAKSQQKRRASQKKWPARDRVIAVIAESFDLTQAEAISLLALYDWKQEP